MNYNTCNKADKRNYNNYDNFNNHYRKGNIMNYRTNGNPPHTATHRCPVILILDTSHAMWGKGQGDIECFQQFFFSELAKKRELSRMIDIAAVSMGENIGMLEEFTPFKNSSLPGVNIRPQGNTPLGGALNLALRKLDDLEKYYHNNNIKYVSPQMIILSDGNSTDDHSFAANRMQSLVAAGKLTCYTIAIGYTPNMRTLCQLGQNLNTPGSPVAQACNNATREVCRHYAKNAPRPSAQAPFKGKGQYDVEYVIDGTNIIHCQHQQGVLTRVLALVDEFTHRSIPFCVFFDASARHHLNTQIERDIYNYLITNKPDRFIEVPSGTDADDYILAYTRGDTRRKIITRDRYKDYTPKYGAITERVIPCVCANDTLLLPQINMEISVPTITNK